MKKFLFGVLLLCLCLNAVALNIKVDSNSVIFDSNQLVVGKAFSGRVTITNDSNEDSPNTLIRIFHSSDNTVSTLLSSEYLNLPANSSATTSFAMTPVLTGTDLLIVSADPLNQLVESNENDNRIEKTFSVVGAGTGIGTPFAFSKRIILTADSNGCTISLSNADVLVFQGIFLDINSDANATNQNAYMVVLNVRAGDGTQVLNLRGHRDEEFFDSTSTRKFYILSVTDTSAEIMITLMHSFDINPSSTCQTDVISILRQAQEQLQRYNQLSNQLTEESKKRAVAENMLNQVQGFFTICDTDRTNCNSKLVTTQSECTTTIDNLSNNYTLTFQDINSQIVREQNSCNQRVNDFGLLFITVIGFAIALIGFIVVMILTGRLKVF